MLSSTNAATIGTAAGILGDFGGGNIFDELNSVDILLQSGLPLTSYTQQQVFSGSGLCVLGAPGRWEVMQFRTAALIGAATYRLSGLLRGRRGTEWAMSLHAAGDIFVLASMTAWSRPNPGTAEIGLARVYKGVTSKTSLPDAEVQGFVNTAMGLECYAPVQIGGGRNADGDVTINWVRRSRIGGEWRDYVDVPLGEVSEAYLLEIWDSDYTVLKRTITGLTSPTATYTATDQTTDFGSPQSTVYLKVYQVSATVGPGIPGIGSV
jgi:hypothetical protein